MEITTRIEQKIKLRTVIVAVIVSILTGCGVIPKYYHAAPITGQVIDKETGEPVAGVHVAVYWQYYDSTFVIYAEGDMPTIVNGVSETITDKNGKFYVASWEDYVYGLNELGTESPIIGLYKKGYVFKRVSNYIDSWGNENGRILANRNYPTKKQTEDGEVHLSIWNNFPAELEKTNNDINKKVLSLSKAEEFIRRIRFSNDKICHQKFIKNLIAAYISEAKEMKTLLKKLPKEKVGEIRYSTTFIKYLNTDIGCVQEKSRP